MDPNATLAELRELAQTALDGTDEVDAERMAELIQALDQWMSRGGLPPSAWASHDVREIR